MILSSFLVCLVNTLTIHTMLTRKKSILYCLVAFTINTFFIYLTAYLLSKYIANGALLKHLINFAAFMYIVYIHITFKESISKKIFTMFSIWMFSSGILSFVILIADISGGTNSIGNIQNLIYTVRIFLQILLLLASYFWLSKPYKNILAIVPDKITIFMVLYPFTALLLLINNYSESFGYFRNFNSIYDTLLFLLFINLGYVMVFTGISASSKIIILKYNYKIIENQVELQRQNYKKLNESMDYFQAMKHDLRHHICSIQAMITDKKYDQSLEYIEQFNQKELSKVMPSQCKNFAADSIIKYYMSIALNKGIEFKASTHIPEDMGINPLDLCVILGNCLENAVEACEKLNIENEKHIELNVKIIDTHLIIKVINTFNGIIVKNAAAIKSSKNGLSHGIGLTSINETANKYNGNFDINYTNNIFEVTVILCTYMPNN